MNEWNKKSKSFSLSLSLSLSKKINKKRKKESSFQILRNQIWENKVGIQWELTGQDVSNQPPSDWSNLYPPLLEPVQHSWLNVFITTP